MIVSITEEESLLFFYPDRAFWWGLNDVPFLEHRGNNNDDFVPTLSRSFHQGLVDKARQMNYDDDDSS